MSLFDKVSAKGSGGTSASGKTRILQSQWGGLSPHLLARFYPVRRMKSGDGWEQSSGANTLTDTFVVSDDIEVWAPITDGNTEISAGWHSPFENAGAVGAGAATLSAMLQSGSLTSLAQALSSLNIVKDNVGDLGKAAVDFLRDVEGRASITKLNSTQVYVGSAPVKITLTAHFRALSDARTEVRAPIQQLREWAVPQVLADDGLIANAVKSTGSRKSGVANKVIETLYPSRGPQIIGMRYGDATYLPLVIESISEPLTNPRSSDGVMVSSSVQLTLATLTALDRRDIRNIYVGA